MMKLSLSRLIRECYIAPHSVQAQGCSPIADYRAVKDLIDDLVSEGAGTFVSPTIQETVAAVERLTQTTPAELAGASFGQIADEMKLDKRAVGHRVRTAISAGYLRNLEKTRGRPARVVLHDAIPHVNTLLPSASLLERGGPELREGVVTVADEGVVKVVDFTDLTTFPPTLPPEAAEGR